jgi:hypothetical protein
MATVNIYKTTWHHNLGHQSEPSTDTSLVAAAINASDVALAALIKSNYHSGSVYQDTYGKPAGTADSRALTVDSVSVLHHNVLSTGATGVCALYSVTWHNTRMNAANTQSNTTLVFGAANLQASAFASTLQTANGDGLTVTVDRADLVLPGVIA